MRFLVISGISGSGKSIALQSLEDLDYYCVDNLPLGVLLPLARQLIIADKLGVENVAVGIDARNLSNDMGNFPKIMEDLRQSGFDCCVFYLTANDGVLKKRFSETRRKHPLSNADTPLNEAISAEKNMLALIEQCADIHIDTSFTNVHELRRLIRDQSKVTAGGGLSIQFMSFAFKHGVPADVDFVFDVRCLPNPFWDPQLRMLTGQDDGIKRFLDAQPPVIDMFTDLSGYFERWIPAFERENRSYLSVAIGCTGGQHRSVYLSERLARHFEAAGQRILIRHRDLK